jgi:uncharacterized membrane protein YsdA (DUF1294 family)
MELWGKMLLLILALFNLFAFLIMGFDKRRAKRREWRVREATLFGMAACGGSLGIWLGMQVFRHKTQHLSFRIVIPLLLLLWVLGIVTMIDRFWYS